MITLKLVPTGYTIYDGPSLFDGRRIVVIMTGIKAASENKKTGEMVQTYILRPDLRPTDAINSGEDASICGDCMHRKHNGAGSCYVNCGQGPHVVHDGYTKGRYPLITPEAAGQVVAGLLVRLGSYGDPAAVPLNVWQALLMECDGWTGYTHAWKQKRVKPYRRYCMASVDSPRQQRYAERKGWRTFRTLGTDDERLPGEVVCPAAEEAGRRKTCAECGACDGSKNDADRRANVALRAHGMHWKLTRWNLARQAMEKRQRFRILDQ